MKKFGIVGEGYTDKVVIENILCGFFTEQDREEEINHLPESDKGGWEVICNYLASMDFRFDVSNHEKLILQIDSDITTKEEDARKFGVFYQDEHGNELSAEALIANIIIQLVNKINTGKSGFYELYADKIIFAICVHCTECWLVAYYTNDATVIHDCDKKLQEIKLPNNIQFSKKQKSGCHAKLSEPFLNKDNIDIVAQKSPSFNLFIQQLHNISL
jgi:hypothetical protein